MESKFAESNAKYRKEFLKADPEARTEARFDKIMDYSKLVYGRFSDAQEQEIRAAMGPYMQGAEARYAERVKRQQEWLGIARDVSANHPPKPQVEAMLRKYADYWQRPSPGEQRSTSAGVDLTVRIANMTTAEQKDHAVKRFDGWINDTRSLMRGGGQESAQAAK